MKNPYFSSIGFTFLFLFSFSPFASWAQDCLQPLGLTKGTQFVYQVTEKGRNKGTLSNQVTQQAKAEDGAYVTTFKSTRQGKTNRSQSAEEFRIRCTNDTLYLDAMLLLREQALKAFEGKDFDYLPTDIAYPQQLKVGQRLPNGGLGVRVRSANTTITKMSMVAQNRQVVGRETIKTPAGTFDCFKITYEYAVVMDAMGMALKDTYKVEEYFSLEHGLIKCQFTTKTGKKAKGLELISFRNSPQSVKK
ncbi:TapB family protein [Rufibacter soli]